VILISGAPQTAAASPAAGQAPLPLTADDWFWHDGKEQQHTEFWTAVIEDASGYIIYLSILRTNFGVGDGNAGIALSLTAPDGTVTRINRQYRASLFEEERNPDGATGHITLAGEQTITFGEERHRFQATFDDLSLDISFAPWGPGYRFGDGGVVVDAAAGHSMRYLFLVPRADITGQLQIGEKSIALSGAGYLEHMVTNRSLTLWSRRFYVMLVFAPDFTVHFMAGYPMETHPHLHDQLGYLAVTNRDGIQLSSRAPTLSFRDLTDGPEGCRWPRQLRLLGEDGDAALEVRWRASETHDAYVVLEQLGWALRRLVAPIVGNPVFLRFHNHYELRLTAGGSTRKVTGRALHQVVCLR
jgi:hypothetical protein